MPAPVQGLVSQGEDLGFYPEGGGSLRGQEGGHGTWVLTGDFWSLQGGQTMGVRVGTRERGLIGEASTLI